MRVSCVVLMLFSAVTQAGAVTADPAAGRRRDSSRPPKRRSPQALAQPSLSSADRQALTFERERMRRILLDFSLTAEDAQARLRRQIPDLSSAEFAAWDAAGLLEHLVIDGRTLYFNRAPSNLFRLSEAAVKRRSSPTPPWTDGPNETANAHHREVRDQALKTGKHARGAAPRARDLLADRESGCGAERRNAARLAAVSPRAAGPAGRRAPARRARRQNTSSRRSRHCSAPSTSSSRAEAGKPTSFRSRTS